MWLAGPVFCINDTALLLWAWRLGHINRSSVIFSIRQTIGFMLWLIGFC
jgi:hypothetical protein